MHFLQAINSDISVLIVCNKTGGTIKGDINKCSFRALIFYLLFGEEIGFTNRYLMYDVAFT